MREAGIRGRARRLGAVRSATHLLDSLYRDAPVDGEELRRAIEAVAREGRGPDAPTPSVLRQLVQWYAPGRGAGGLDCRVVDPGEPAGLLWWQAALARTMEHLRAGQPTLLLLGGLREGIRDPGRRWTARAAREHEEVLANFRDQIARWSLRHGTPVTLWVA
jgi:hypothetical protein